MTSCKNCIHAEMCKWIDELDGRGCYFYDGKPCELLILKSDILLHQDDRKKWAESIEQEKAKGLIILPPYFTPVLVPDDVEIQIEQEPCDDAISREAVIDAIRFGISNIRAFNDTTMVRFYERENEALEKAIDRVNELPSVQPSKCEECGAKAREISKYSYEYGKHDVIEDIKADIEASRYGLINDGLDVALRIIDKHTEGR